MRARLFSFVRLTLLVSLAGIALPGCSLIPGFLKKKKEKAVRAKPVQLIGTISLVNEESGFALIDNGSFASPAMGDTVECRAADGSVAHLKVTEVRKRPFAIADIVDGVPKRGDRVYQ